MLWLLVKEPSFKVPLRYSQNFVGSWPFKFGRVRPMRPMCMLSGHKEAPTKRKPPRRTKNCQTPILIPDLIRH